MVDERLWHRDGSSEGGPELRRRRRGPALNTRDGETDIGIPAEFSAIAPIVGGVPSGR
jgi:hypothetical protein